MGRVSEQSTTADQHHSPRGADQSAAMSETGFFVRTVVGWDVAFWAMLGVVLVIMLAGGPTGGELAWALALLGLLGGTYALVGRPAIRTRKARPRHTYRVVLALVVGALVYLQPEAGFLLFIAFPQVWVFSERVREGVAYTFLIICGLAVAEMARSGWSSNVFIANLPWWSVSVLVSLVFGTWVSKIIDESEQRAELIRTLKRTQAELAAAHHAAGVVAERERIAREIHDTLAQGFTGIITLTGAAQALVARGDRGQALARLGAIEDIARDNLGEARALVAAFSPLGLDDTTLVEALQRLATRFESETGVRVTVSARTGDDRGAVLSTAHQVVLLRTAQEALANVRKHAAAACVEIVLSTGADGHAAIEVTDDGSGFEPTVLTHGGFGLAGMRGRVEDAGGQLQVDSAPGAGTLIRVRLPATTRGTAAPAAT